MRIETSSTAATSNARSSIDVILLQLRNGYCSSGDLLTANLKKTRAQHAKLIDRIVTRLKSVPEGSGTMFDNTVLLYFPDNGETHHSQGVEWPFVVLAGRNAEIDLARRYVRLPKCGDDGHTTLGNWYTTLLNAYGRSIEHYGALDPGLVGDHTGPIERFLA